MCIISLFIRRSLVQVLWREDGLSSRFKMFRPSSSSTFGLWLSLLRRNTRTTFWTIVNFYLLRSSPPFSLPRCSFLAARVLERNPLCFHLASNPRLCCLGRGAPHIWKRQKKKEALILLVWEVRCWCVRAASRCLSPCSSSLLRQRVLKRVVRSCWGAPPLVSLVTACLMEGAGPNRIPLQASPAFSWNSGAALILL